jgi:hypothetical protein
VTLLRLRFAFVALVATSSCSSSKSTDVNHGTEGTRVLFIGSSYLYYYDIPGFVQALADSAGGEKLAVGIIAGPDMALIDHLNEGTAARAIAQGGWAWVVLQQGPSSVEVNRDTLRLATRLFADEIARVNARPALFSAWPSASRRQDFDRAIESYRLAATDVNGLFLPVASAWLAAWESDPAVALYADGLHPSAEGSYLSALVIYAELLRKNPTGLPARLRSTSGQSLVIGPATAKLLQAAAAKVTGFQ